MATRDQWRDVYEIFTCSICLDILKEPKILTCLHRFCKVCLQDLFKNKILQCPVCKVEIDMSLKGVGEFKTDFLIKDLLETLRKKKISTETTESLTCAIHSENIPEFVCLTCGNCFVCRKCIANAHKDHEYVEVTTLNEIKAKSLAEAQQILQRIEEKKLHLYENAKIETQKLVEICGKDTENISKEIETLRYKIARLKSAEETQIEDTRKEYKIALEKKLNEIKEENTALNEPFARKLFELEKNLKYLNTNQKSLRVSTERDLEDKLRKIGEVSHKVVERMTQLKDINTRKEIDSLIAQISSEYELLEKDKIFDIGVDYRGSVFRQNQVPSISGYAETANIFNTGSGWYIDGIAVNDNGKVAITESTEDHKSRITVVDENGKVIRYREFAKSTSNPGKRRFCEFITSSKIVTVYQQSEIGIYDVSVDFYEQIVTYFNIACMAIDRGKDLILVGSDKTKIYSFDFELVDRPGELQLPRIIEGPRDIAVGENGHLLVCDFEGSRIYETTLTGSESRAEFEFSRPDFDGEHWRPLCLCTDRYKGVYSLWLTGRKLSSGRRILVQYGDNGRKLLATREIDADSRCVTVIDQKHGGSLLIATWKSRQLYSYDLKYEEVRHVGV